MTTYVSIHRIKTIRAEARGTMGAPVKIEITNDAGSFEAEVCLFTDSLPLSRRIAYQRQQDSLMEDGGRDDSAFRREITNAGRGHLLR